MENTNKKLALYLLIVSVLMAIFTIIDNLSFKSDFMIVNILRAVLALILQCLLGYTILRDKNDKLTVVSVFLITVFTLNLAGLVAIIMRLVLRKKEESQKIRNAWFVPAIVSVITALISILLFSITIWGIINIVLDAVYYLIFGYWFIKYLKVN